MVFQQTLVLETHAPTASLTKQFGKLISSGSDDNMRVLPSAVGARPMNRAARATRSPILPSSVGLSMRDVEPNLKARLAWWLGFTQERSHVTRVCWSRPRTASMVLVFSPSEDSLNEPRAPQQRAIGPWLLKALVTVAVVPEHASVRIS